MSGIIGASITYRLAFGPHAGKKVLTLQAVPVSSHRKKASELVSKQSGFSLHAGVACKSNQRMRLERPGSVPNFARRRFRNKPSKTLERTGVFYLWGKLGFVGKSTTAYMITTL